MKKRLLALSLVIAMMVSLPAFADEWTCTNCNAVNTGKFCGECAQPSPAPVALDNGLLGWICPGCNQVIYTNFCADCGIQAPAPNHDWVCPGCSKENSGKFCIYCGTASPAPDAVMQAIPTPEPAQDPLPVPPVENANVVGYAEYSTKAEMFNDQPIVLEVYRGTDAMTITLSKSPAIGTSVELSYRDASDNYKSDEMVIDEVTPVLTFNVGSDCRLTGFSLIESNYNTYCRALRFDTQTVYCNYFNIGYDIDYTTGAINPLPDGISMSITGDEATITWLHYMSQTNSDAKYHAMTVDLKEKYNDSYVNIWYKYGGFYEDLSNITTDVYNSQFASSMPRWAGDGQELWK